MQRVTIKTSTIFIAKRGRTKVYHSVNDVPPRLRKELEDSTNSLNSATILIADRRGRQEIMRVLNGLPSSLRTRLASSLSPRAPVAVSQPRRWKRHRRHLDRQRFRGDHIGRHDADVDADGVAQAVP